MDIAAMIDEVIAREGGYSNHPADRGGPTNFGITQGVARENGYGGDMRALPGSVAEMIYRRLYWEKPGFAFVAELAPAVAEELFDTAVNMGATVAGGFLSERWLDAAAPVGPLANRSLVKYRLIIDEFGGWPLFQELLRTLATIGRKHGCGIATVATRAMLERPEVSSAIVGATDTSHLDEHRKIGLLALDAVDHAAIRAVTNHRRGPLGDVYALERDRTGAHGRIMQYTLNR